MGAAIEKICEMVLAHISSYELFNNLLPGSVYIVAVERILHYDILVGDIFRDAVMCYVVGLLIGRIGSLVVEELLKKIKRGKWLGRIPHEEYVAAEAKDDGKMCMLSMVNNAYRSLTAAFLCIFVTIVMHLIWFQIFEAKWLIVSVAVLSMMILMCFSYKRQTGHVVSRVKAIKNKTGRRKK